MRVVLLTGVMALTGCVTVPSKNRFDRTRHL